MVKLNSKYLKMEKKRDEGITLVALVITIIVLLILAGVTIRMATSGSGIFGRAKNGANTYREAARNENTALESYDSEMDIAERGKEGTFNEKQKLNAPILKQGMTPVKFEADKSDATKQKVVKTTSDDEEWYNYENKEWANAETEDGSLWVWIPRFAYRINKGTQSTSVVFLSGTTDTYVDDDGTTHEDVKRCKSADDTIDTSTGWTVHPTFTDESSEAINFRNGGWDTELYGIWVAKFEAAYATNDNVPANKVNVSSGINYSQSKVWASSKVYSAEIGKTVSNDGYVSARNYIDGKYSDKITSIKYPTFQGSSYSMIYININDSFNLVKKMTASGNIYGLGNDSDSHIMKNSEWGAVAYLSKSQYGLGSTDISVNSKVYSNNPECTYAGTGYNSEGKQWNDASITSSNSASTSGNIYGVYDMSGGSWERTAAYVYTTTNNFNAHGKSLVTSKDKSTKYVTVYPNNQGTASTENDRSQANYNGDTKIYGDAVKETSTAGTDKNSWYTDQSIFPEGDYPFFYRGGGAWYGPVAGLFHFHRSNGNSDYITGFRAVII